MGRKRNRIAPKKVVIIVSQGDETETTYFRNFKNEKERHEGNAVIRIHPGEGKDPIYLIKQAAYLKKELYKGAIIEKIYCVYDVDETPEESLQLSANEARKIGANTCISNPCFEMWYLLHFGFTTARFCSYREVKGRLLSHIPEYAKNKDVYEALQPHQLTAISNAKQLQQYHHNEGTDSSISGCCPSTQVHELVEYLNNLGA